ncbi:hypothetical protein P43SY_000066 [Pythium insidiosum]|uniref:Uncharacterized protein n=1 Tax=Pythium insidiosum TaxID=114742 RepID=A0AAD5LAP2_PYTIN|nr:hypothetical protein P43SY_000066 [Pythium insidiosum]
MSGSEQLSDQAPHASSDEMSAEPRQPAPGSPTPDPASAPSSRALVPFSSRPWQFFSATAPPATISWRDVVARVGRGLTRRLDAAGEADDALRRDLAAARGVLDQRLLYLFNATAASAACSPAAASRGDDDWAVPALTSLAEAARLAAVLRGRYGAHRLVERISSTALACSWLTHVVQSLFELVRLQDLEHFTDQESPPLAALEAYSRAQIAASQRRSAQRDDALHEEGDYEMGDDGDFAGDDLGDDDLCVAIPATQASASLPPAAPPRPAPLVIDVDADDAADMPPAHADRADHVDAADSEAHSARGVKRRAASLVAEDAMSAQRLARQLRTEGLGTPASAKRNRGSPGSGPSPTITSITTGSQATSPAGSTPSAGAPPSRRELVAAAALARSQGDNVGGGDAGGAGPSAPGDAPLTFTGSDAASHVASHTAVPAAPPGVALAPPVFPCVPLPFALGNVRGRSSVLRYNSLDETQSPKVGVQFVSPLGLAC